MILTHKCWYFKKAIPIKICKKILKAGREKLIKKARTSKGIDKITRDCEIAWLSEKWIYDIINPFIHSANKNAGWNFKWDWNEDSQFTIYEKGHYYNWHYDQQPLPLKHKHKNKNINGKIRKLSLTLQLTDKSQYTGGDFQFKWIKENQDLLEVLTVDGAKDIGTVIVFPSFIDHRILPITKGKRESLVNWSLGRPYE